MQMLEQQGLPEFIYLPERQLSRCNKAIHLREKRWEMGPKRQTMHVSSWMVVRLGWVRSGMCQQFPDTAQKRQMQV